MQEYARTIIYIIGISAQYISKEAEKKLHVCETIVASPRILAIDRDNYQLEGKEVLDFSPLKDLLPKLLKRLQHQNVAILASGDPLFYGIGKYITQTFTENTIEIIPSVSSMQRLFAGVQSPWESASFMSVHGRDLHPLLKKLKTSHKLGLFTDNINTPEKVASFLQESLPTEYLQQIECVVGEHLESSEELSAQLEKKLKRDRPRSQTITIPQQSFKLFMRKHTESSTDPQKRRSDTFYVPPATQDVTSPYTRAVEMEELIVSDKSQSELLDLLKRVRVNFIIPIECRVPAAIIHLCVVS